jgi:hypothetical protein
MDYDGAAERERERERDPKREKRCTSAIGWGRRVNTLFASFRNIT